MYEPYEKLDLQGKQALLVSTTTDKSNSIFV